jgi:hypothetical protein
MQNAFMVGVANDFVGHNFHACASADRGELRAKPYEREGHPAGFTDMT